MLYVACTPDVALFNFSRPFRTTISSVDLGSQPKTLASDEGFASSLTWINVLRTALSFEQNVDRISCALFRADRALGDPLCEELVAGLREPQLEPWRYQV